MSMIGNFVRVSNEELNQFLEDSSLLENRIYPETDDDDDDEEDDSILDIDKTWEAIYYLLTGFMLVEVDQAQPPFSWLLFSNQIIDEGQDMGYGPATYATPDQVKEISAALTAVPLSVLREKYDKSDVLGGEVYPFSANEDKEEVFEYIAQHYEGLREFYQTAAQNGEAVVSFLN